jgi:signal transduction histidine kinase
VRLLTPALALLGIACGLVVEWTFYDPELGLPLAVGDAAVGCVLLVCGTIAWERRRESRVGPLMGAAGVTWFLGNVAEPFLYLHRGPLVHLHLSYPTGRLPTRLAQAVVGIAYLDALVEPLAANDWLTLALSGLVAVAAIQVFVGTSGPARKAGGPALAAALAFAGVLALGAVARLTDSLDRTTVLWIYDVVIASIAVSLLIDLLRSRWAEAVVTGLVVDLGSAGETATLRGKLANALGDPALIVGYRLPTTGGFVDDAGRPVELPVAGSGMTVTAIEDDGERVAVLVHDEALLADRQLVESVAAAARVAVANARLQAEARTRADELEASRRRIVEAADAQRRRLEQELRLGAERRLDVVAGLLADARAGAASDDGNGIATLEAVLADARRELQEFAHGIHPAALTEGGLMPALAALAERSVVPVEVRGEVGRLTDAVEAALFFVCSEALANVAKHARATRVTIEVRDEPERVAVVVADDGIGGASVVGGTGLRGLADRVEALGGRLEVASPRGGGTRIVADVPLDR